MDALYIRSHRQLSPTVYIPHQLMQQGELETPQQLTVKSGQIMLRLRAVPHSGSDVLYLPAAAMQKLHLRPGLRLNIRLAKDMLHIGPIVGIMTTPLGKYTVSNDGLPIDKQRKRFFSRFIRLGYQHHCLFYLFMPENVDWDRRLVYGYTLKPHTSEDVWVRGVFPLPDVIWNRVPHRGAERREPVVQVKAKVNELGTVKLFPQDYFYKGQLYDLLKSEGSLADNLPETRHLNSVREVLDMLKKYSMLFIKPISGSHGHGIIRLDKEAGALRYSYQVRGQLMTGLLYNAKELREFLVRTLSRKHYIVQQGLYLAQYQGRHFDIRATVQKGRTGEWQIAGLSSKVAGKNSVTTHVCNGGTVLPIESLFNRVYDEPKLMIARLEAFALSVAQAVERATGWFLGELGMDIGIDTEGKLWLFEVNSKPGRIVFAPRWAVKARQRSYELIVEYSMYLAGFGEGARAARGGSGAQS